MSVFTACGKEISRRNHPNFSEAGIGIDKPIHFNTVRTPMPSPSQTLTPDPDTSVVQSPSVSNVWIKRMAFAFAAATIVFHLACAALGRPFFRDHPMGAAINFARGSINLLRPVIPGFNLNGIPTPQELPTWQASTALFMKAFGTWFGWGNVASLFWFFTCLYPLHQLAENYGYRGSGWWTLLLFLSQPLIFTYAGLAGPDGQAMVFEIWFLYFAARLWEKPGPKWFVATAVAGALAALTKVPFLVAAGVACALFMMAARRRLLAPWIWLAAAAAVIAVCFLAWESYANRLYAQAESPCLDMRSSTPAMVFWYFGDWHYRLSPLVWIRGAYRVLADLFGSFVLFLLFFLGLIQKQRSLLASFWLIGGMVSALIFFHIVLNHYNYYLMLCPAVAVLSAQAAMRLEHALAPVGSSWRWAARVALPLTFALSLAQGLYSAHAIIEFDDYPYAMADIVRQHTSPSERLLVVGNGFGGWLFLLADRDGLSAWNTQALEDKRTYARLKQLGYTKLVMVSESPLVAAIERSNHVRLVSSRLLYQTAETPVVATLPTIFQTDDILIKSLP